MSMPWPRWPLLLAALVAGPSLAAGAKLAPVSSSTLVQLRAQQSARATQSLSLLKDRRPTLGLGAQDDFSLKNVQTDDFGLTHARFQQLHQGIPVWGAVAITHLDASGQGLTLTSDGVRPHIRVSTRPVVDSASAAALALLEVHPLGLSTQPPTSELVIYPEVKQVPVAGHPRLTRINAEDLREEVVGYRLAWYVHTVLDNAQDGVKHTDFLLDAHTGTVLKRWNALQTAAAVGRGHSQYNGDVDLDVFQNASGTYELRDTTRAPGEGLRTYDIKHARVDLGVTPKLVSYQDADNEWGDGQNYNPTANTQSDNGQTAAVDAHFGLLATWDYYQTIHHRFGIDDKGTPTFNRMHAGVQYDNAFWSDECYCMSYGDGSYPRPGGFRSVNELDVTGHELSHGVTAQTAALIYTGESGGLNEANSDIFGTMTEFWVRNGRGDTIGDTGGNWTIGEQLGDSPLRYMYKPSLDGYSLDAWFPGIDKAEVHSSSGPMNHAFYFLSQGARPASPANNYSSNYLPEGMKGVGNDKAAAIWYRALTVYLTPFSNYLAARTASLRAAADLHGTQSEEYRAVQNAFAAINVGYSAVTYDDITPPTVSLSQSGSGPLLLISARATDNMSVARVEFFVDSVPAGFSLTQPYQFTLDTNLLNSGTHTVRARATDIAGNTRFSDPLSVAVSHSYTQLLVNPGFEQGSVGWVQGPDYTNINDPAPGAHSGQGFVWLNGYGATAVDSVYQEVAIPADAQTAALTYYLKIFTDDLGTQAQDTLTVQVRDTQGNVLKQLDVRSNLTSTIGWVQQSFDLTEFKGRTVQVFFRGSENNDGLATSFQLDDFALRVTTLPDTETPFVTASVDFDGLRTQVGLQGNVSDNGFVSSVELIVDGTSLGTVSPSFEKIVNASALGNGLHSLVVRAKDAAGQTGTSAPVSFYLDPTRSQRVLNPDFELGDENWILQTPVPDGNGIFFDPGYGLAHSGYDFVLFGIDAGPHTSSIHQTLTLPADNQAAIYRFWLWSVSTAFTDGVAHHTFAAQVRDANGNLLETLETFSNLDLTPFYVEHRYDLSAYKGKTIQLFFEVKMEDPPQDPSGYSYFFLDDVTLDATSTPDTLPPTLIAGVQGTSGTVGLYANVSDNVWTATLEFLVDGTQVGLLTNVEGVYTLPYDTRSLSVGPHQFTLRATDRAGNTSTTTVPFELFFQVDGAPPTVSASVVGSYESTVFHAEASDDTGVSLVEFYVDDLYQGHATTAPYSLPFSTLPLRPGMHTLKVVALDAYGHTATATALFTREGPLLSASRAVVAVNDTYDLSTLLVGGLDPLLLWSVQEGPICGSVTSKGLYSAPDGTGLCHVLITNKQDSRQSARVDVRVYTADLNQDRIVDGEDMARIAQAWGTHVSAKTAADLDASGTVDDTDVTLFVSQFGR